MDNFSWNCLNPSSKSNIHPCSLWKLGIKAKIYYFFGVNTPPKPFQQGGKPSSILILVKRALSSSSSTGFFQRRGDKQYPKDWIQPCLQGWCSHLTTIYWKVSDHLFQYPPFLQSFVWLNWIKRILDISFHHPALICSVKLLLMLSLL